MTSIRDIPVEISDRARVIIQMAENTDAVHAADILVPWVKEKPEHFVEVLLALAAMADPSKRLRDAHAAWTRGDRTPAVIAMEREYQRARKRKTRAYEKSQGDAA